jgi:alkylation response protein AidB-like acyl-CoA dehydrogenase
MDFSLSMEQQMIHDVSRDFAENEIAEGTSEIQRLIIARVFGSETFD